MQMQKSWSTRSIGNLNEVFQRDFGTDFTDTSVTLAARLHVSFVVSNWCPAGLYCKYAKALTGKGSNCAADEQVSGSSPKSGLALCASSAVVHPCLRLGLAVGAIILRG